MKAIILFLVIPFFAFSQQINLGAGVSPMLHTQDKKNLQDFTMLPNLILSIGNKDLQLLMSFGAVCKFGTLATSKHVYGGMYYVVNTVTPKVEHGAEIEFGFNHFYKNMRFFAGASIGMLVVNEEIKLNLRPFNFGFTFKIFDK